MTSGVVVTFLMDHGDGAIAEASFTRIGTVMSQTIMEGLGKIEYKCT